MKDIECLIESVSVLWKKNGLLLLLKTLWLDSIYLISSYTWYNEKNIKSLLDKNDYEKIIFLLVNKLKKWKTI